MHPTTIVKRVGPKWVVPFILLLAIAAVGKKNPHADEIGGQSYNAVIPLGALEIDLKPSNREMYILASAESPFFEGCYTHPSTPALFSASGRKVAFYPAHIDFRLTATAMRPKMLAIDSYGALQVPDNEINNYLLHLRFNVLVFRGLYKTIFQPTSVRLLGMPADVPYEERIYTISFDSPRQISIYDRLVLEVLSPSGERLCTFHLDLF